MSNVFYLHEKFLQIYGPWIAELAHTKKMLGRDEICSYTEEELEEATYAQLGLEDIFYNAVCRFSWYYSKIFDKEKIVAIKFLKDANFARIFLINHNGVLIEVKQDLLAALSLMVYYDGQAQFGEMETGKIFMFDDLLNKPRLEEVACE